VVADAIGEKYHIFSFAARGRVIARVGAGTEADGALAGSDVVLAQTRPYEEVLLQGGGGSLFG
jgi:hypothetical protein